MSDNRDDSADDGNHPGGRTNRVELLSAILLGIAATLTAVSAFFSSAAGGDELAAFNAANQALNDANFFFQQGNETVAQDNQLFIAYLEAEQAEQATAFVVNLMSPELQAAIEDWLERDDIVTPFESEEYVVEAFATAAQLQADSEAALADAGEAGDEGDLFDLSNVIFALALFAGGVVNLFRRPILQTGLLAVGVAMIAVGTGVMITGL